MLEFLLRNYKFSVAEVIDEIPAVQLAMLYRCFAQGVCGVKSTTLGEMELARKLFKDGAKLNGN